MFCTVSRSWELPLPHSLNDVNGFFPPFFRYSTSLSPPSPRPVKHQDIEIEDECEFLIDELSASSTSWISIPAKNKKSKSDGSATPISKLQPSEKEKSQNKKVKNRKVQAKAFTKQKLDHLDVGTFDFEEMSESDPILNSEENVLTSQSQKSAHTGKLCNSSSDIFFQVPLLDSFLVVYKGSYNEGGDRHQWIPFWCFSCTVSFG